MRFLWCTRVCVPSACYSLGGPASSLRPPIYARTDGGGGAGGAANEGLTGPAVTRSLRASALPIGSARPAARRSPSTWCRPPATSKPPRCSADAASPVTCRVWCASPRPRRQPVHVCAMRHWRRRCVCPWLPMARQRVRISLDGGRVRTRRTHRGRKTAKGRHGFATPWREPRVLVIDILDEPGQPDRLRLPLYDVLIGNAAAV